MMATDHDQPPGRLLQAPTDPEERARYIEQLRKRYEEGTLDQVVNADDITDELLELLIPTLTDGAAS